MHILLTGATGCVGGQLLPVLLRDGHDDRAPPASPGLNDEPLGFDDAVRAALDG